MTSTETHSSLVKHGWAAVPRSHAKALSEVDKNKHAKLDLDSVKVPSTHTARKVLSYAQATLPEKTYNHSMRVWIYGMLS